MGEVSRRGHSDHEEARVTLSQPRVQILLVVAQTIIATV